MEYTLIWMSLSIVLLSLVAAEFEGENTEAMYTEAAEEIAIDPVLQARYKTPQPTGEVYFSQTFDDGTMNGWVLSNAKKEDTDEDIAKYDGQWETEALKSNRIIGDKGLVLKSVAKHHATAAMLKKPFVFDDRPLIVQYEVNFQNGIDCGGAYIKLLSTTEHLDLEEFYDKTPYTIMFGPDKCGDDYKMHFIFNHKNPKTGLYEEKHVKRPEIELKTFFSDMKTHLYTLVLKPDNTFEMLIDQKIVNKGHLLEDMIPPVNPPKEIDDPDDRKPDEWDEELRIPDPSAVKPEDWNEDEPETTEDPDAVKPEGWLNDEPEYIPDPNTEKPQDWDEEADGEWTAAHVPNPKCESAPGCGEWTPPMIANPSYKGKWLPPMVENPNYQGKWSPRRIPNPNYFDDQHPFKMTSFAAIGLELWSMTSDIYFDNFIICSEKGVADQWAYDSWSLKKLVAIANEPSIFQQMWNLAEENPWVWIICLISGVPVLLLVIFLRSRKKKEEIVLDQGTDELRPGATKELEGVAKEETQKEAVLAQGTDQFRPCTKGALEGVEKEKTQKEAVLDQGTFELRPSATGALEGVEKENTRKEDAFLKQGTDELRPPATRALEGIAKENTQKEDAFLGHGTDDLRPAGNGALECVSKEDTQKEDAVHDPGTDELRPAAAGALKGLAKEDRQKEDAILGQGTEELRPRTKGALEAVAKEEMQNEGNVHYNTERKVKQEVSEKEHADEQKQEDDTREDIQQHEEEDSGKPTKPASDDDMKHANGGTMSENGPRELLRKRRLQSV